MECIKKCLLSIFAKKKKRAATRSIKIDKLEFKSFKLEGFEFKSKC